MPVPYYRIVAKFIKTGEDFECFIWRGDMMAGIASAQIAAQNFGYSPNDLYNFRAIRCEGPSHG